VSRDKKPRRVEVNKTLITRGGTTRSESKSSVDEVARAQALRRERIAREFSNASQALANGASATTKIDMQQGPGGGGVPYANFLQAVQSVYQRAWQRMAPQTATDRDVVATASVTIGRDGTVVSSRLTESSGNRQVDRAVKLTLDQVDRAAPLPDNASEDQRTVTIEFESRPKLGTG
jgi:TonB family protein